MASRGSLQRLAANPQEVRLAGARARQALLDFYDLPHSIERIASILGEMEQPISLSG